MYLDAKIAFLDAGTHLFKRGNTAIYAHKQTFRDEHFTHSQTWIHVYLLSGVVRHTNTHIWSTYCMHLDTEIHRFRHCIKYTSVFELEHWSKHVLKKFRVSRSKNNF